MPSMKVIDDSKEGGRLSENKDQDTGSAGTASTTASTTQTDPDEGLFDDVLEDNALDFEYPTYLNVDDKNVSPIEIVSRYDIHDVFHFLVRLLRSENPRTPIHPCLPLLESYCKADLITLIHIFLNILVWRLVYHDEQSFKRGK